MDTNKYGVMVQAHRTAKPRLSRTQRLLRYLQSLCRKRTRSVSDPAPQSHFRAYRQRYEFLLLSAPCRNESEESRTVSPEFSPPDFRPFPIDLRSITALGDSEELSNFRDDAVTQASYAESEAKRISNLRSYQFGQINGNRTETDDETVPPATPVNPETKDKVESRDGERQELSRRHSLLANLRCLQSRLSAHGEKIDLSLSKLADDIVLKGQNEELERKSDKLKRESDEHRKKSNILGTLANLVKLNEKIGSLATLLENPMAEPHLAFYTNAWLAVHQMNELESTARDLLFDMETSDVWDGKVTSSIQSSATLAHRASVSISKIIEEVNPRCERLITKLEKLALEATMPRPQSITPCVCPLCGKET